jgi:hypothetical protein
VAPHKIFYFDQILIAPSGFKFRIVAKTLNQYDLGVENFTGPRCTCMGQESIEDKRTRLHKVGVKLEN